MGVNKVICKNETIMDITSSTVTEENLLAGVIAFNAAGDKITGTLPVNTASVANWIANPTTVALILPEGITTIGDSAFRGCLGLYGLEIPETLKTIGGQSFRGCTNLTGAINLKNVTKLGGAAFRDSSKISSISMDAMEDIGDNAFRGLTAITSVTLPGTVNAVRAMAFSGCTGLATVTFTQGDKTIPTGTMASDMFSGCTALTDIYVYWAEGKVANAPWGAPTGCKIHYSDKIMQVQSDGTLAEVTE